MPIRPSPYQAKFDRLNAMAQRGPLSQTNQRNLAFYQKRLGTSNMPQTAQAVSGSPFTPQAGGPQGSLTNDMMGSPTSGPGAPLPQPAGATSTFQNTQSTVNGMPPPNYGSMTMKKGGKVKKMASGGMTSKVSSASSRADGIAQRGKTKCKIY